jgi:hypothetical protein
MRAILVIGWKGPQAVPEGLYCGLDGVKAAEVAAKARATGKYYALRKVTNLETVGHPLPTVPEPKPEPVKKPTPPAVSEEKPETSDTKE